MKLLKVNLWGKEIGRLAWDDSLRRAYFSYSTDNGTEIPDIAPLISPARSRNINIPVLGDDSPLYQGLPPFIADSLPDSWGNTLFDKWAKSSKIPRNKITPLHKLMFIGKRGMGALEYEPCASDLSHSRGIDLKSLYDMSLSILADRDRAVLSADEQLTLQALLSVGTSAGGRQMKAIIAIDNATGEIRSGQTDLPAGFEHYILKFGDDARPMAEIEAAYYRMAVEAGIDMEESRLLTIQGQNHFLTKRFDRRDGRKIHMQTLAAINPEARSYEDLIFTCRELGIAESEIRQIFARMVFNVMAGNTDDHNKNFSFLLEENGKWRIAPAYDITFIFNPYGTGPNIERRLSVGGKTSEISKSDLMDFARRNDIRNPSEIIDRTAGAIKEFYRLAEENGVTQPWRGIIQKALDATLALYGYAKEHDDSSSAFTDMHGRAITGFSVSVNTKGYYEVTAFIDGRRHRRFISPDSPLYDTISRQPPRELIESLFPPEAGVAG